VVLAGDLNASIYAESHIILVGMQESFSLLQDLTLAQAVSTDDGILQMFNSPWNSERALLWVGGGSEAAVLKAAAALGSGIILTSQDPAVAFVSQMPESPALIFDQDQTFADLGQSELTFKDIGSSQAQVEFYIPSGTSIGADAYLDLVLNHSQLMDYSRSGIVVRLNHVPVGSVRLSDTTASLNSVRLIVPASALRTGTNLLEVQVDLIARNICTDPRQGSLWVTIFPDSLLHLPVSLQPIVSAASPSLAGFPAPFTSRDLDQTTFVLSPSDPAGWTAAARLAFQMGVESSGSLRMPAVLRADASSAPVFADSSLIAVGLIPQMSFLPSLSTSLPAPLDASGALSDATHAAIGFEITPGTSMGYLELAASAVSTDTAFLAVLGSDAQGLNGAVNALLSAAMRRKMEGSNFALVQGSTVSAHRLSFESQVEQPVIPGTTAVPQGTGTPATAEGQGVLPPRQDRWALPAMALSGILIILLVVLEALSVVKKK